MRILNRLSPRKIGYVLATLLAGTAMLITGAGSADAALLSHRDVHLSPAGGELTATISWLGPSGGPYHGKVSGATADEASDGKCVIAEVLMDGQPFHIPDSYVCRANHPGWKYWSINYSNTFSVKIRMCLTRDGDKVSCTGWH